MAAEGLAARFARRRLAMFAVRSLDPGAGLRWMVGASGVAACEVAAASRPAFVYVFSPAMCWLPHVACELRYFDQRFGARMGVRLWLALVALLLGYAAPATLPRDAQAAVA